MESMLRTDGPHVVMPLLCCAALTARTRQIGVTRKMRPGRAQLGALMAHSVTPVKCHQWA
eukprot:12910483-Prorocentrum_lima.AAC.1